MSGIDAGGLLHMVWLATNACSLRCAHCSSGSGKAADGELDTAEALDLVEQFAEVGVVDMAISGGEPLLRRDLPEIVAHAVELGIRVGVGTSGLKLSSSRLAALRDAGLARLQVSLDGIGTAHDALRRHDGLYDKAVAGIVLAREMGLRVHVCCTINRYNADQLGRLADVVADLGVARFNFSRFVPTGRGAEGTAALDLSSEQWRVVATECLEIRDRYAGRMEVVTHLAQQIAIDPLVAVMPAFVGCQAGRAQGCVAADGTVWPCVLLPLAMGNVRDRRLDEIWRTAAVARDLRDRTRLDGECAGCGLRERCGGCRAVAYARTGNHLATDPRCWIASQLPRRGGMSCRTTA